MNVIFFKGVLPGMCSSVKQPHDVLCSSNRDCSELTKCCYNYCQDLMVKGEGISMINCDSFVKTRPLEKICVITYANLNF